MPPWLPGLLASLTVGLIMFFVNKLTTKGNAEIIRDLALLKDEIKHLKEDGWTTEQRVQLGERFTRLESNVSSLKVEVNFTQTAHQEFLRLLEKAMIPVAHSPHTPELDDLLDKRERGEQLTSQQWQRLIDLLGEHADEYADQPGKKVSLLSLRAIYLTQLKLAQKREAEEKQQFQQRSTDVGKTSQEIRGLRNQ
jgi:hypothetical protein